MTDQELRKLSRKDLLELLISLGRERDALQEELEKANAALQDRQIRMEQAGSLAEAALQLNGVFEAAQQAAEQYLENIRQHSEHMEEVCAKQEAQARQEADRRLQEAAQAARTMEEETRRKCREMEKEAKAKSEAYWREISIRLEKFYQEHEELKQLLASGDQA